jgi:hypothetical protein
MTYWWMKNEYEKKSPSNHFQSNHSIPYYTLSHLSNFHLYSIALIQFPSQSLASSSRAARRTFAISPGPCSHHLAFSIHYCWFSPIHQGARPAAVPTRSQTHLSIHLLLYICPILQARFFPGIWYGTTVTIYRLKDSTRKVPLNATLACLQLYSTRAGSNWA